MKTIPDKWAAAQIAFFAGIISAEIRVLDLKAIVDALSTIVPQTSERYFHAFLAVLEPRISEQQWLYAVATCERLFK